MLNKTEIQFLSEHLIDKGFSDSTIIKVETVSGGSINQTFALHTNDQTFFLKKNRRNSFPQMFEKEINGLKLLSEKSQFLIPKPLLIVEVRSFSYFIMEYISNGEVSNKYWESFGEYLAMLHKDTTEQFGLEYDNYIGSLVQRNSWKTDWADFFIENRLMVQEKLAKDARLIDDETNRLLIRLYKEIPNIFPKEKPALLHGDLWSGNFLPTFLGQPCIIDPAVYYGNREMDIAMSLLFGGFDKRMYEVYSINFPLQKGWEQRIEICNLYPLLVHVNLFGAAYANRVKHILKRIVG